MTYNNIDELSRQIDGESIDFKKKVPLFSNYCIFSI